tara:strand:+ start:741 stop:1013 length:273 start_codon:yes stop_codon:yes gene_type:complete
MNIIHQIQVDPPTPEQELALEMKARDIINSDDKEETARLCATLFKTDWYQKQLLISCFDRISELQAKVICLEKPVKQPKKKNFFLRILGF